MIRFYKDNLVPAELCRMLYAIVPKKYHVPVRSHNRRRNDLHGESGSYPLGSMDFPRYKQSTAIDINLNLIYKASGKLDVASLPSPPLRLSGGCC